MYAHLIRPYALKACGRGPQTASRQHCNRRRCAILGHSRHHVCIVALMPRLTGLIVFSVVVADIPLIYRRRYTSPFEQIPLEHLALS